MEALRYRPVCPDRPALLGAAPPKRRDLGDTRARPLQASRHEKILVLDIETTADAERLPVDWGGGFPKPAFHKVACISYLTARIVRADTGTESYRVERCVSGGQMDWNEATLLSRFWEFFASGDYRVVSWNGRRFDCSVLRLRALIHGIAVPSWYQRGDRWANYASRYAGWHLDVMEALNDHGATTAMGLDETAILLGLPGKIGGNGGNVADQLEAGRLKEVRDYCEADVLNTAAAYFRWAWHSGTSTAAGHDASVDDLVTYLEAEKWSRPHFGEFLQRWKCRHVGLAEK